MAGYAVAEPQPSLEHAATIQSGILLPPSTPGQASSSSSAGQEGGILLPSSTPGQASPSSSAGQVPKLTAKQKRGSVTRGGNKVQAKRMAAAMQELGVRPPPNNVLQEMFAKGKSKGQGKDVKTE